MASAALLVVVALGPAAALAPASACPASGVGRALVAEQLAAMLCMTNFARQRDDLGELTAAGELNRSDQRSDRGRNPAT